MLVNVIESDVKVRRAVYQAQPILFIFIVAPKDDPSDANKIIRVCEFNREMKFSINFYGRMLFVIVDIKKHFSSNSLARVMVLAKTCLYLYL